MNQKTDLPVPFIKRAVKNNDQYLFAWQSGEPDTNVVLQHKKLAVQILRYLITSSEGDILYDGIAIKEALNNAVMVIRNREHQLGLVLEWRPIPARWFWACPRGFGDPDDEDNIATAKREAVEEIGNFMIVDSKKIGSLYQNTTFYENPVGLVLLDVEAVETRLSQEEGVVDFKFFTKKELMDMIREDKIEDTFTLSAIMKYLALEGIR
jgi:8-oxo-dGTP pyrophosphatase MutT (NUDIX family)